ncbi:hypothetical protein ABZP36_017359 [Zizania latifolia]
MKNAFMLLVALGSLAIVAQGGRTTYAVDELVKPAATGGDDKPSGLADFIPENNCFQTNFCLTIRAPCYRCIIRPYSNDGFPTMKECMKKCPFPPATTESPPPAA